MALILTLDASVFVAACRPREPGHHAGRILLELLQHADIPFVEPSILPIEVGSALCRAEGNPDLARSYAQAILALPRLLLVTLDTRMTERALATALQCRLRGADALYVTAAAQYGSRLVTLDAEQLERSPRAVSACTPETATAWVMRHRRPSV